VNSRACRNDGEFQQGRVSDPDRAKELMARHSDELATARPDVLDRRTSGPGRPAGIDAQRECGFVRATTIEEPIIGTVTVCPSRRAR